MSIFIPSSLVGGGSPLLNVVEVAPATKSADERIAELEEKVKAMTIVILSQQNTNVSWRKKQNLASIELYSVLDELIESLDEFGIDQLFQKIKDTTVLMRHLDDIGHGFGREPGVMFETIQKMRIELSSIQRKQLIVANLLQWGTPIESAPRVMADVKAQLQSAKQQYFITQQLELLEADARAEEEKQRALEELRRKEAERREVEAKIAELQAKLKGL